MANKYKYVCTVFTLFGTAPACVRGSGQRISCMSGTRYRSPDSRPSESVNRVRVRDGLLANRGGAAVSRSVGPAGVGGSPAAVRVVGESGWGGDVPVCRKPGARVCRIKRVSVCPAVGRQSDADTGVGRPESGGADECRVAFGRMPGLPGYAWVSQPNRSVGLPERGACCGYGRSAVLARKNEGSPERLPSPSKINP